MDRSIFQHRLQGDGSATKKAAPESGRGSAPPLAEIFGVWPFCSSLRVCCSGHPRCGLFPGPNSDLLVE